METLLPFKPVELGDRAAIERRTVPSGLTNCDLAFANMYCWQESYRSEWCEVDGLLVIRFRIDGGERIGYMQPVGTGDFTRILPLLEADAAAHDQPLRLIGLTDEAAAALPDDGRFVRYADRDFADYLYRREELCRLGGRHYQPKRNHINRFLAAWPDYRYEPLTERHFAACLELDERWCHRHEGADDEAAVLAERRAIRRAFAAFDALGLRGGCLFAEERLVAFTYGSAINPETFDIHVEKADTRYEGAFAMINRLFAEQLPDTVRFINREEDLGIEGLRRAKLSYYPALLPDKVRALRLGAGEQACKRLWESCFPEDDPLFVDRFLLGHYLRRRMLAARSGETIVSMLHRIPFDSEAGRMSYLYAVATDPAHRGRGHASRLVEEAVRAALAEGDAALFLIAADEGLRAFYRRFGFEGDIPVRFHTPDGFDFGTGDPTRDRAMLLRLDPSIPLPERLDCHLTE